MNDRCRVGGLAIVSLKGDLMIVRNLKKKLCSKENKDKTL